MSLLSNKEKLNSKSLWSWTAELEVFKGSINKEFLNSVKSISKLDLPSSSDPDSGSSHSSIFIPENGVGVWKTLKSIDPVLSKGCDIPVVLVNLISIFWLDKFIEFGSVALEIVSPFSST